VSCTKGIEPESGKLMTQILEDELGLAEAAVLSGPNLAREVATGEPAAAVIGARDPGLQQLLQPLFSLPTFRAYTSDDSTGIQLGGALKNIYAIGAGCADGFRMGTNAKAGLVTRCLAEMMRLGVALGGKRETFSGLSGIGDLMVTCFGSQSRNRQFGERLGRGETRAEIEASTRTVAEGIPAALSAWQQAHRLGVDTPVIDGIHAVLYQDLPPREVMMGLLGRSPKAEAA
jgi:glycerol-3-phosphate dehydrogenase (NAD(P)+)